MKWGKFILLFQAIITLVIGLIFVFQILNIDNIQEETEKNIAQTQSTQVIDQILKYQKDKDRLFKASYIIVLIALMEMIIIWRLFDSGPVTSYDTEFDLRSNYNLPVYK